MSSTENELGDAIPPILLAIQAKQQQAQAQGTAREVAGLGEVMREVGSPAAEEARTITARLRKKFGLGEQPEKRMRLYLRLEALEKVHGERIVQVISEAVAESITARFPDRYFCKAVAAKLKDAGLDKGTGSEVW